MPETDKFVFDSYALIGYLENESFAGRIETILKEARKGLVQIRIHAIHIGEVYYITFREQGQDIADLAYSRIRAFPVTIVETVGEPLLLRAARLKARNPLSYADCFAAALAMGTTSTLATGDPEFRILEEKEKLDIEWLI